MLPLEVVVVFDRSVVVVVTSPGGVDSVVEVGEVVVVVVVLGGSDEFSVLTPVYVSGVFTAQHNMTIHPRHINPQHTTSTHQHTTISQHTNFHGNQDVTHALVATLAANELGALQGQQLAILRSHIDGSDCPIALRGQEGYQGH